jgi:hypothetical protein
MRFRRGDLRWVLPKASKAGYLHEVSPPNALGYGACVDAQAHQFNACFNFSLTATSVVRHKYLPPGRLSRVPSGLKKGRLDKLRGKTAPFEFGGEVR